MNVGTEVRNPSLGRELTRALMRDCGRRMRKAALDRVLPSVHQAPLDPIDRAQHFDSHRAHEHEFAPVRLSPREK